MNASRFQGENKLHTAQDSDSSSWTSVCLHNLWTLGTRLLFCTGGFALTKYPSSGIGSMSGAPKARQEMIFIDTKQLTIPTSIAKQRKFILSSPTFSRFFLPLLECLPHHPSTWALRLPPL